MDTYAYTFKCNLSGFALAVMLFVARIQLTKQSTPAIFVFGDSLVDPGNNNYILSLARANVLPNGIDFPAGPTGRFCNGRTVVDIICELSGFPFIPAYFDPSSKGANILLGVNYASGAGGILPPSGANYVDRISLPQQITYFENTIAGFQQQLGNDAAATRISKSIFSFVIGSNDYINNYLLNFNTKVRDEFTPEAYQNLVLSAFSKQLQRLYQLGARKFVVSDIGPLGCLPSQLSQRSKDGKCIEYINTYIINYNIGLRSLLNQLNSDLSGATFLYASSYDTVISVVNNPASNGFKISNVGCCGAGKFNGQVPCIPIPSVQTCPDRNDYLFWDAFHPTDAFNVMLGNKLFSGGQNDVYPINIQQLIQL